MATDAPPITEKQLALNAIARMPVNATIEEISERMAMLAGLRRAERDSEAGRFVSHQEALRRSLEWTRK